MYKLSALKHSSYSAIVYSKRYKYGMLRPISFLSPRRKAKNEFLSYKEWRKDYSFTLCNPNTIYYCEGRVCVDNYNINSFKDRVKYIKYSTLRYLSKCNCPIKFGIYKNDLKRIFRI